MPKTFVVNFCNDVIDLGKGYSYEDEDDWDRIAVCEDELHTPFMLFVSI